MERRKFTREFKLEAVRLIKNRGVSYAQAEQDLAVHQSQLRSWVKAFADDPAQASHLASGCRGLPRHSRHSAGSVCAWHLHSHGSCNRRSSAHASWSSAHPCLSASFLAGFFSHASGVLLRGRTPADVFAAASTNGTIIEKLLPGAQVSLIETCVYRKPKPGHSGDEGLQESGVNL